jgi:hypothetical protein
MQWVHDLEELVMAVINQSRELVACTTEARLPAGRRASNELQSSRDEWAVKMVRRLVASTLLISAFFLQTRRDHGARIEEVIQLLP